MRTPNKIILIFLMTAFLDADISARPELIPQPKLIPEPCRVEGECEIIYDSKFDWQELRDMVLENKVYVNPVFSGILKVKELKNVVILNGRLGDVDLSGGAVLDGVVFRGNQITSLNFAGAKLNRVFMEGNLKQQPTYGIKENRPAEPIPLNLSDALVQNSIFVNNVILVNGNPGTAIHRVSFTRNNMVGSSMRGVRIDQSDFTGNDARKSDFRFGKAADVKIVNNQVHGVKYPKLRKARITLFGNWANNPDRTWGRLKLKKRRR